MTITSTGARFAHQSRTPAFGTYNFLIAAKKACEAHGIPITLFGRLAVGDPRFLGDLEHGRIPRPATEAKVLGFIAGMAAGVAIRQRRSANPTDHDKPQPRRRGCPAVNSARQQNRHREAMARGSSMLLAAINGARKGA